MTEPSQATAAPAFSLSLALTNQAARSIVQLLSADASDLLLEHADQRDEAMSLLRSLFEKRGTFHFYMQNGGTGFEGDQLVNLWLTADSDAEPNCAALARMKNWPLVLVGTSKRQYYQSGTEFLLIDMVAFPPWLVERAVDSLPGRITFDWTAPLPSGMPPDVLDQLRSLPARRLPRDRVRILLADWRHYLEITQRLAKAKCFSLNYTSYRLDTNGRKAQFQVAAADGFDRLKVRGAMGEEIHIEKANEEAAIDRAFARLAGEDYDEDATQSWPLGKLEQLRGERIVIELADDVVRQIARDRQAIPKKGTLHYRAIGELAQIHRLQWGLQSLQRGRARNYKLHDFLFDPNEAGLPDPNTTIQLSASELLLPNLNEGQWRAVEGALNAPDLYLIQGPPGTGKTTVIAEICYQVALRGGRTMVASQANLAVDHAMSRLVHHPSIRALRRGRAESVEEEGQPYIEEYVIGTWLDQVARDCRMNLKARSNRLGELERLGGLKTNLEAFQEAKTSYQSQIQSQKNAVHQADQSREATASSLSALQQRRDRLQEFTVFLDLLRELVDSDREAWDTVAVPDLPAETWQGFLGHDIIAGSLSALAVLEQALCAWTEDPASTATEAAFIIPHGRTFIDYLQRSRDVTERASEILAKVAGMASQIDELHNLCRAWYTLAERERPLLARRTEHLNAQADARARVASLQADIGHCEAEQQEIEALARDLSSLENELPDWLLQQATVDDLITDVPRAFRAGVRRGVWNATIQIQDLRLDSLRGLVSQTHQLRKEADTLGCIVSQIDQCVGQLLREVSPSTLQAEQKNPPDWRQTNLRNMITEGSDGILHPVREAEGLMQFPLETTLKLSLSPDPKKRPPERGIAKNIAGFRRLSADLLESQRSLMRLVQSHGQELHSTTRSIAAATISKLQDATESRLQQLTTQLRDLRGELVMAEYKLELAKAGDDHSDDGLRDLMRQKESIVQKIKAGTEDEAVSSTPPLIKVVRIACDAEVKPEEVWERDWHEGRDEFDRTVAHLAQAAAVVRPVETVQAWVQVSQSASEGAEQQIPSLEADLARDNARLRDAQEALGALEDAYQAACQQWTVACEVIPKTERAAIGDITSDVALVRLPDRFTAWAAEREDLQNYLRANTDFITDWIGRIESRDKRDEADLHQIYIDNANVIGITCVQAGSRSFSERYRDFDTVIVDEVSKATPPELLLPMLKGAKVVLVGDSRQLPPMVGPEALTDLAESLEVDWRDLEHLNRSLFRDVFERSPSQLKSWLTGQYRMHPQIMDAINQFYHDKLVCKIDDPDRRRAHGLEPLIPESTHIAWISTEWSESFYETRVGTSRRNDGEVEIVANLVARMNDIWGQGPSERPPKEVGIITFYRAQEEALRSRLSTASDEQPYEHLDLRLGTVDRFQGMEKPVIIVSLVCNNNSGDIGFAKELERINVAFSRAQELLVIVGCRELFCRRARSADATARYSRVADVVRKNGGILNVREFITH